VTASASWLVLGHQLRVHGRRAKMYPVKDIFPLLLSSYSRQNKLPSGFPTASPIPRSRLSCRLGRRWPNCMGSHVARHRVKGPSAPVRQCGSNGKRTHHLILLASSTSRHCPTPGHMCTGRARLSFVAVLSAGPDLCTAAHACRRLRLSRRVEGILPRPGLHARPCGCNIGVLASKRQHQPAGFSGLENPLASHSS
jgi:hypothetical protein